MHADIEYDAIFAALEKQPTKLASHNIILLVPSIAVFMVIGSNTADVW